MPLGKVTIRDCRAEDLASVQEIENGSFDDPYPPSLFLYFLKSFPRGFRVASFGETLVGYCTVALEHKRAIIASLAVSPVHRRRRVGRSLLQDAISLCKAQFDVKYIELQVREDNNAAISLYSGFGFLAGRNIRNYYGEGKDALSMSLDLSKV